ncbi:MAG: sn-glycerol-3-phosphate ABC transporter ATP-binding protein UgpC [Rhodobacteraceae bacterium]|nr:sn-glycerol-3-phosphate ABC transporter ATP-binding protein UgpC [Paracoccaceae bacterium]
MSGVRLNAAVKRYGETQVIHGVDLAITEGEFCVFVGPSGCGKSTLLRMIAGLEETSAGTIFIGSRDVTHLDPAVRGVAMVFQTYALYPHMTVAQNMGFGLRMNGVDKATIRQKVAEASRILQLDDYLSRKPKALSGGQRQRVAIGRAIVRGPEVFLFDEPLSNLDAELRVDMRVEIARLHKEIGATMIYVTHDQVEAMTLADKIVVLRAGRIEQVGTPMELYHNPDNQFVAGFIGSPAMNFLKGAVQDGGVGVSALGAEAIAAPDAVHALGVGAPVIVGLRPQALRVRAADAAEGGSALRIDLRERLGGVAYDYLHSPTAERIVAETRGDAAMAPGSAVAVEFAPADAFFFAAQSGARLR